MNRSTFLIVPLYFTICLGQSRWPIDQDNNQITASINISIKSCSSEQPIISPPAVGFLRLGMSVVEVEKYCNHIRYGWNGGEEGIFEPVAIVRLNEVQAFLIFDDTLSVSTIYRIILTDTNVHTKEGFGIGSSIGTISKQWGTASFGEEGCELFVWFPKQTGISFKVKLPIKRDCGELENVDRNTLNQSKVKEIILTSE